MELYKAMFVKIQALFHYIHLSHQSLHTPEVASFVWEVTEKVPGFQLNREVAPVYCTMHLNLWPLEPLGLSASG